MRVPASVQYLDEVGLIDLASADARSILGVIGYGGGFPDGVPLAFPFVQADLAPLTGMARFEVWRAPSSAHSFQSGAIRGSVCDDAVFGLIALDEAEGASLQDAVARAYHGIFDFLEEAGFTWPVRFWNYLPDITDEDNGMERYRRFNIGRVDAFEARLRLPVPPVASAVGGQGGSPLIYFLGARHAAKPIENPRQVSAYHYPAQYGPRSPRFSRASILDGTGGARMFLISGTASIVGHESRPPEDPAAQVAETIDNIAALIDEAGYAAFAPGHAEWSLKAYIRYPEHLGVVTAAIEAMFGTTANTLLLRADMCRPELLLEIEAVCVAD
jgi:chorismate lyase/3-hydroxybenzoate synthase